MTPTPQTTAKITQIQRLQRVCEQYLPYSEFEQVVLFPYQTKILIAWVKARGLHGSHYLDYAVKEIKHENIESEIQSIESQIVENTAI